MALVRGTDIQLSEALQPACKRILQYRQRSEAISIDSFDGLAQQAAPVDYVLWHINRAAIGERDGYTRVHHCHHYIIKLLRHGEAC